MFDEVLKPACVFVKNEKWYEVQRTENHFVISKIQGAFTRIHNKSLSGPNLCLPNQFIPTDQGIVIAPYVPTGP